MSELCYTCFLDILCNTQLHPILFILIHFRSCLFLLLTFFTTPSSLFLHQALSSLPHLLPPPPFPESLSLHSSFPPTPSIPHPSFPLYPPRPSIPHPKARAYIVFDWIFGKLRNSFFLFSVHGRHLEQTHPAGGFFALWSRTA